MKLRDIFLWVTGAFWIGVAYYAVRCQHNAPPTPASSVATANSPHSGPRVTRRPGLPPVTAVELARHATPGDCWVVIAGTVYDVTGYVDLHPSKHQEMEHFCGQNGTRSWDVKESGKDRGEPHTKRAAEFLEEYPQVGVFQE